MALDTAVTIVQRASAEVGIPVSAAPFSSTDESQELLIRLLNSAGKELANYYEWPELDRSWTISAAIDGTSGTYALPADFGWAHNETFWDTTNGQPISGPQTSVDWARIRNSWVGGVGPTTKVFRQFGTNIEILPTPLGAADVYTLEYTSSKWVKTAAGQYQFECTAPDDVPQIDGNVLGKLVKLRWLEAKGFATGAASIEFNSALSDATFRPLGAPRLYLNGIGGGSLIGYRNISDSGYGS